MLVLVHQLTVPAHLFVYGDFQTKAASAAKKQQASGGHH